MPYLFETDSKKLKTSLLVLFACFKFKHDNPFLANFDFEILKKYKELKNGLYEDSNRWKVYVRLMNKQLDTTKLIERVDITY